MSAQSLAAASGLSVLRNPQTERDIPIAVYEPPSQVCSKDCPILLFQTGYLAVIADYSFLLKALSQKGYFVVGVQLDLPSDAPMPNTGNIVADRTLFWTRGVSTVEFVVAALSRTWPSPEWAKFGLAGHSQGGDVAAMYAARHPDRVRELVTLDNLRIPLPWRQSIPTLTLRSSDQHADVGVLPGSDMPSICIVQLESARHDDLNDHARQETKEFILTKIFAWLGDRSC